MSQKVLERKDDRQAMNHNFQSLKNKLIFIHMFNHLNKNPNQWWLNLIVNQKDVIMTSLIAVVSLELKHKYARQTQILKH